MQNLGGGKQGALWGMRKWRILQFHYSLSSKSILLQQCEHSNGHNLDKRR